MVYPNPESITGHKASMCWRIKFQSEPEEYRQQLKENSSNDSTQYRMFKAPTHRVSFVFWSTGLH